MTQHQQVDDDGWTRFQILTPKGFQYTPMIVWLKDNSGKEGSDWIMLYLFEWDDELDKNVDKLKVWIRDGTVAMLFKLAFIDHIAA